MRDSILESIRKRSEDTTDEIVTFAEARLTEEVLGVREVYLDASRAASTTSTARWPTISRPWA